MEPMQPRIGGQVVLPLGGMPLLAPFERWWVASMVGLIAGLIAEWIWAGGLGILRLVRPIKVSRPLVGACPRCPVRRPLPPPTVFAPKLRIGSPVMSVSVFHRPARDPYVCHPRLTTTTGRAFFLRHRTNTRGSISAHRSFFPWLNIPHSVYASRRRRQDSSANNKQRGVRFSKLGGMAFAQYNQ